MNEAAIWVLVCVTGVAVIGSYLGSALHHGRAQMMYGPSETVHEKLDRIEAKVDSIARSLDKAIGVMLNVMGDLERSRVALEKTDAELQ